MFTYFTVLKAAVQKSSAENRSWKIGEIHQEAFVVESIFSPVKLDSAKTVLMTNF